MSSMELSELQILRQQYRLENKTVIFTNGCFDILHAGHVRYLTAARALGDILIVGLNSDASVRKLKGKGRPVNPAPDRAEVLAGLRAVDHVVVFDEDTAEELVRRLQPDIYVKGGDYSLDRLPISEPDFCALIGNLLDNAIEGAMRVTNAKDSLTVHLSFSRSWDMFYIYCANPCNAHTIRRHKSVWRSSKRPDGADEPHALGISNMERIAREAAGRCVFSVSEGMFMAKIVLPYSMAERGLGS